VLTAVTATEHVDLAAGRHVARSRQYAPAPASADQITLPSGSEPRLLFDDAQW
jgi:hypothetical protein